MEVIGIVLSTSCSDSLLDRFAKDLRILTLILRGPLCLSNLTQECLGVMLNVAGLKRS